MEAPSQSMFVVGVGIVVAGNFVTGLAFVLQKVAHNRMVATPADAAGPIPLDSNSDSESGDELTIMCSSDADGGAAPDPALLPMHSVVHQAQHTIPWRRIGRTCGRRCCYTASGARRCNGLLLAGMALMIPGELANFAALAFVPAVVVIVLGGLGPVFTALLARCMVHEPMGKVGYLGTVLVSIGVGFVVVATASDEVPFADVEDLRTHLNDSAFLVYIAMLVSVSLLMMLNNSMVNHVFIMSACGCICVLTAKALAVVLGLVFEGKHPLVDSVVGILVLVTLLFLAMQASMFQAMMRRYGVTVFVPAYYVGYSIASTIGSALLYRDFDDLGPDGIGMFVCGGLIAFGGNVLVHRGHSKGKPEEAKGETAPVQQV